MLATAELVHTVATAIRDYSLTTFVLDPVMVSTSGDRLLAAGAETAIMQELLPLCTLVTPNLDEAAIMVGYAIPDAVVMERAARDLAARGAAAVLLKGGHLPGDRVIDILFDGTRCHAFERGRIDTRHTHGTGCTLSAAITAGLAHGHTLRDAVVSGLDFVHAAIETAPNLGRGSGPLNHFATRFPPRA
jgi:hydroxymethylpyrimidine/phosphomethylpyrimidine kinase